MRLNTGAAPWRHNGFAAQRPESGALRSAGAAELCGYSLASPTLAEIRFRNASNSSLTRIRSASMNA